MAIRCKKGFTFPEVMIASTISLFVVLAAWSIYVMSWAWWAETLPRIEAQRIVRIALMRITEGMADPACDMDWISGKEYPRRNGIAWAIFTPATTSDDAQVKITYPLEGIANQSFFMNKAEDPRRIYHNSTVYPMVGTTGITDLVFQVTGTNIVKVTAAVERDLPGTRRVPYHLAVRESQTVYLRNV